MVLQLPYTGMCLLRPNAAMSVEISARRGARPTDPADKAITSDATAITSDATA